MALKLYLISDFNLDTLGHCLANDQSAPQLSVSSAPFGQVLPPLLTLSDCQAADFVVVWTSPEATIPSFAESFNYKSIDEDQLISEVQQFAELLRKAHKRCQAMFVVSWTIPHFRRGNGILSLKQQGTRRLLLKMNLQLADELADCGNVYLLDGQRWMEAVGKYSYSPKLWYMTKTPFHADLCRRAARELKAAIAAVRGESKKLVILDLDNTLWGGVVADVGWENLRLGGHDYLGEAFLDFQKALKALRNRGIVLAVASKNDESIALEAISKHPEMVLRLEDFAAWRINWNDKATNVAEIAAELNLGLQSAIFIDDNRGERDRVREALPEVYVPEWPDDKTLFASQLMELDCFDAAYSTAEDASRTSMYAAERQREFSRKAACSVEEWLISLQTEVTVEEACEANRVRVLQLLNKTNQMNLSTRRLSDHELQVWLQPANRKLWAFRVKDKFGDSGVTGILSLEMEAGSARIIDFVLSCRLIGRKVENAMVAFAVEYCMAVRLKELHARYVPTAKNKPCLSFWMSSGFSQNESENRFTWQLCDPYPFPKGIRVSPPHAYGSLVRSPQQLSVQAERASLPVANN